MTDLLVPISRNAQAVALIDRFLPQTESQSVIDARKVGDLLLDLRLLLTIHGAPSGTG